MAARRLALLLGAALVAASLAHAGKLDDASRQWLEGVAAIVLPDEARTYRRLADRRERAEFERIFWARRDPDLQTSVNEYQETFLARKAEADRRFAVKGQAGSATGCGRLLVLFGEPDLVREGETGTPFGHGEPVPASRSGVARSGATQMARFPSRRPEVWTYRDRDDLVFPGGQAEIPVDAACAVGPALALELDRIAGRRVVHPGLAYRVSAGRLTRLEDLLPRPSPARTLVESGRRDFPVAGQLAYVRAEGATALVGLVRADAAFAVPAEGRPGPDAVMVVAQATDEEGRVAAVDERRLPAPAAGAGPLLVGYRLYLRPGRYTLRYGVSDERGTRGAAASETIDVPDLDGPGLSAGSLLVVEDVVEGEVGDPRDPLDAFVLGELKVVPRFGHAFSRSESASFLYGATGSADPLTGKSSLTVDFSLRQGGRLVASAPSQSFDERHVLTSVGPIALGFAPGAYTARVRVRDNLTGQETAVEQAFEIR